MKLKDREKVILILERNLAKGIITPEKLRNTFYAFLEYQDSQTLGGRLKNFLSMKKNKPS